MKLMILPHAGGSSLSYCNLKKYLGPKIEIVPMEPAGRGKRINEKFFQDIPSCVSDLLNRHKEDILKGDYCLFGHSMGTMLASELVRQILKENLPTPKHVFLSGRSAIDENPKTPFNECSTKEEIIEFFIQNGLIPQIVTSNKELLDMISNILYADVQMTRDFVISSDDMKFPCDISVIYGTEDEFLKCCGVDGWKRFTMGKCDMYPFPGGHFYYTDNKQSFCEVIRNVCLRESGE